MPGTVLTGTRRDLEYQCMNFLTKIHSYCKKWVKAIRREKWFPTQSSVLCSTHFSDDCFVEGKKNRRLKKDAVPSIFNFPKHLQEDTNTKMKKRKSPKKRLLSSSPGPSPQKLAKFVSSDHVQSQSVS